MINCCPFANPIFLVAFEQIFYCGVDSPVQMMERDVFMVYPTLRAHYVNISDWSVKNSVMPLAYLTISVSCYYLADTVIELLSWFPHSDLWSIRGMPQRPSLHWHRSDEEFLNTILQNIRMLSMDNIQVIKGYNLK